MGVLSTDSKKKTYYRISAGKLVRKAKEGDDPSKVYTREKKNGEVVSEFPEDGWQGRIIDMEIKSHPDFDDQFAITVDDGQEQAVITFMVDSGYGRGFMKKITNVDFTQELGIQPFYIEREDKPGSFNAHLGLYQGGVKLQSIYSKENPLPDLEKMKVKGKDVWDNTAQMEVLKADFAKAKEKLSASGDVAIPVVESNDTSIDKDDDLPF